MRHEELKTKALGRKTVKAEYDALRPEFTLLHEMLAARQKVGLSQAEIAKRMGTKPPAVTRLESSLSIGRHSPSIATLKKFHLQMDGFMSKVIFQSVANGKEPIIFSTINRIFP